MSIVRAIRLANSLEAGTTDATALEALLADNARKGELGGLMTLRGQARRLADNAIAAAAVAGSPLAVGVMAGARVGADEFAASPIASAALAANRNAMRAVTLAAAGNRRWIEQYPWTMRGPAAVVFNGVAYGAGIYVAVGNGAVIYSSTDLITWTQRVNPLGGALNILDVTFAFGLFIAVNSSGNILTSPDGINWTQRANPLAIAADAVGEGSAQRYRILISGDNKVAFACYDSTATVWKVVYSSNGTAWSASVGGGTSTYKRWQLAYGNGAWLWGGTVDNGSLSLWRAPDITAAVWTSVTPAAISVNSLTFANGYFYISVGSNYYRSLNGVTWSLLASAPAGMSYTYCVQAVAGLLLAVGGGSSTAMGYSADGLASFRMLAVPFNGSNRVHLVNDMIVLTGTPGGIYTNY